MSLLKEIQDLAVNSETPLASLLRKCKVLSARLGSKEFGAWVDSELSGYISEENLPSYRVFRVNSKGDFYGLHGAGFKNADIPMSNIHEKFRESLSHTYIMQSIASIESLVSNADGVTHERWNPDIVKFVSRDIYQNMNCVLAYKVVPVSELVNILDQIRNKVLSFVLEIELVNPKTMGAIKDVSRTTHVEYIIEGTANVLENIQLLK